MTHGVLPAAKSMLIASVVSALLVMTQGDDRIGCWTAGLTEEDCCNTHEYGPMGRKQCWDEKFTFQACCLLDCWVGNFASAEGHCCTHYQDDNCWSGSFSYEKCCRGRCMDTLLHNRHLLRAASSRIFEAEGIYWEEYSPSPERCSQLDGKLAVATSPLLQKGFYICFPISCFTLFADHEATIEGTEITERQVTVSKEIFKHVFGFKATFPEWSWTW